MTGVSDSKFPACSSGGLRKAGEIAAATGATYLSAFQILPADLSHEPGESINLSTALRPKSDSRAAGLMTSISREAEERFRPVSRAIADKTKRW